MDPAAERLLTGAWDELAGRRPPASTYRLQFHKAFTFRDAERVAPYLHALGVTDCYASPYLKARPGSTHGYDIIDHNSLNPEVGSQEDYDAWVAALRGLGMGQLLDTVPNHMAVGNDNAWWQDVLENGPASPYAGHFDIAWTDSTRPEHDGRVLVPILGDPFAKVLESQQLRLEYAAGVFTVSYFEHRFPVAPRTSGMILGLRTDALEQRLGGESEALIEYQSILTAVRNLPPRTETDPARVTERRREKEVIKRRLAALTAGETAVREFLDETVAVFNGRPGDSHSFDLLEKLLDEQVYRLAYWRVAADEINYRRFFDINELAALSMEREEVFAATHEFVLRLVAEGKVTGLRIDHPDGLYDPRQYLLRLQQQAVLDVARRRSEAADGGPSWEEVEGPVRRLLADRAETTAPNQWPLYVAVEKILGADESLPDDWPTSGTTGYDFMNVVNGLFVDPAGFKPLTRAYREWTDDDTRYAEVVYQKKNLILQTALSSELQMLTNQLDRLAQRNRWSRDFTRQSLQQALREVIAFFPVYRSYIDGEVRESDRRHVLRAVRRAMGRNPALSSALFLFIRDLLLQRTHEPGTGDMDYLAEQRRFAGKFQQVTAPVTAKGVEDTTFYVYNRLLSLNEVGGEPDHFGLSPAVVHAAMATRRARWPLALSATATHDTKRGEDVRARLNALSEMPEEWAAAVGRWHELNRAHRGDVEDEPAPDRNEEWFIYQTLLGAWPVEPYSAAEYRTFIERVQAYMVKALHEAKVHTSWINPNAAYDDAVTKFVGRVLDPANTAFLDDFRPFLRRISRVGVFNSLAQVLVKLTAPGVPDVYQGTELWDLNLVDPDNRRPVDYDLRRRWLEELDGRSGDRRTLVRQLVAAPEDGRVKLYTLATGLRYRRENPDLFTSGDYHPLSASGARENHVFAFARTSGRARALVVIPRLVARLLGDAELPCGPATWGDTAVAVPELLAGSRWRNVLTGTEHTVDRRLQLPVGELLVDFPVALLLSDA
jgi:(1->4)-alpha-D-glucan 1-alpha-D-glucosylmutase